MSFSPDETLTRLRLWTSEIMDLTLSGWRY